ncbi:uncharacterized protein HD556DRAFT_1535752 [Suillus plorans]|uniref:Uncharacterized protein n=1 Tax=Suillus plorans TaxID=116603 RepID=A0A9P7AV02_9AGAM|nr:uncharacterized protein HD556DRAFT_1314227 [Suillus plorans]XP_041161563.1 uncharacterized protein HD556DRAFT_1535752 [Suillus plorans]KAG1785530.1 hypothetical protein HD556DRAFT_1314227 [Suillus plorans]KAG1795809.1 hypothetical protein HD556DRAFT_1535752 [Suillus plorans]
MNVGDSEWRITDDIAEFNEELQISDDLLLLRGRKVDNVSDVKIDNCTPSGDRYDRTGHREDKCTGKYQVQCVGNIGVRLADKCRIERRLVEGTTIQMLLFDPKGFLDQAQGSEERKYHEKLLSTLTPTGNW